MIVWKRFDLSELIPATPEHSDTEEGDDGDGVLEGGSNAEAGEEHHAQDHRFTYTPVRATAGGLVADGVFQNEATAAQELKAEMSIADQQQRDQGGAFDVAAAVGSAGGNNCWAQAMETCEGAAVSPARPHSPSCTLGAGGSEGGDRERADSAQHVERSAPLCVESEPLSNQGRDEMPAGAGAGGREVSDPPPPPDDTGEIAIQVTEQRRAYLLRYTRDQDPSGLRTQITAFLQHRRYRPFDVGDFVLVFRRMQPGDCRPEGLGHIVRAHQDHYYDVRYSLGSGEKSVDGCFIKSLAQDELSKPRRKVGRCQGCGAFLNECLCERRRSRKRPRVEPQQQQPQQEVEDQQMGQRSGERGRSGSGAQAGGSEDESDDGGKGDSTRTGASGSRTHNGASGEDSPRESQRREFNARLAELFESSDEEHGLGFGIEEHEFGEEEAKLEPGKRTVKEKRMGLNAASDGVRPSAASGTLDRQRKGVSRKRRRDRPPAEGPHGRPEGVHDQQMALSSSSSSSSAEEEEEDLDLAAVVARQYGSRRCAREYKKQQDESEFIRDEGCHAAKELPKEALDEVQRRQLDQHMTRAMLQRRVRDLLVEFSQALEEYEQRMRRKVAELKRLRRQLGRGIVDGQELQTLTTKIDDGLEWLQAEMDQFVRVTSDVVQYCMNRLVRAHAITERLDVAVEAYNVQHGTIDKEFKLFIREVYRENCDAKRVIGMGKGSASGTSEEDDGDDEEGDEESDDGYQLTPEDENVSPAAAYCDPYAERPRRKSGCSGHSRLKIHRRSRATARDTLDGFIVPDSEDDAEHRAASPATRRRKSERAEGGGVCGGDRTASGGGGRSRGGASRGHSRRTAANDDDDMVLKDDWHDAFRHAHVSVEGRSGQRGGRRGGTGGRRHGHSGAAFEDSRTLDDYWQPQAIGQRDLDVDDEGCGHDIELLLSRTGAEGTSLVAPSAFDPRPVPHPLAGHEGPIIELYDDCILDLNCSWLNGEEHVLTAELLPFLYRCAATTCHQGLLQGLEALCRHLRSYGGHYSNDELAELDMLVRRHTVQLESHVFPTGPEFSEDFTCVWYWHMLDWAEALADVRDSEGSWAAELVTYVLHRLVASYIRSGSGLRLNVNPKLGGLAFTALTSSPSHALWLKVFRMAEHSGCSGGHTVDVGQSRKDFWELFADVIWSRSVLQDDHLATLQMALGAGLLQALNHGTLECALQRVDASEAEMLWMLIMELVRLEVLNDKLAEHESANSPPRARDACWALVLAILKGPPLSIDVQLAPDAASSSAPSAGNASTVREQSSAPPLSQQEKDQYMVTVLPRLMTVMRAWKSHRGLVHRLWSALLRSTAARLQDSKAPHPAFSTWMWLEKAIKDSQFSAEGSWDRARDLIWSLTDTRYFPLPHYLFLPPPEHLERLPDPRTVQALVSRGSDQLLLLTSCLLEQHMSCIGDNVAEQKDFLVDLCKSLDSTTPEVAILGLHNLAMTILLRLRRGHAQEKVIVNFWRRLKAMYSDRREGSFKELKPSWIWAAALAVQFLGQMGPVTSGADVCDFMTLETIINDNLVPWFGLVLGRLPGALGAPVRPLAWSLVMGLSLLQQITVRAELPQGTLASLQKLVCQLLKQKRDLDDASLALTLRLYERLWSPRRLQSQGPTYKLMTAIPGLSMLVRVTEQLELDARDTGPQEQPQHVMATGSQVGLVREAINALMDVVREAWQSVSSAPEDMIHAPDREQAKHHLRWHLHAIPALQGLALVIAAAQSANQRDIPAFTLLSTSLDNGQATYRDSKSQTLRLLAPVFFDALLSHRLTSGLKVQTINFQAATEWDVLACWLSLTLEVSSWKISLRKSASRPAGYISRHYWGFTARLVEMMVLRRAAVPRGGIKDFGMVLNLDCMGQELTMPNAASLGRLLTYDQELVWRLTLLAVLAVWIAKGWHLQTHCGDRQAHQRSALKVLSYLPGALPLLASPRRTKSGRVLAYAALSIFMRWCGEGTIGEVLNKVIPLVFGSFVDAKSTADSFDLSLAVMHLGDLMRYMSQGRFTGSTHTEWLTQLVDGRKGAFSGSFGAELQQKAFISLSHGVWHLCACEDVQASESFGPLMTVLRSVCNVKAGSSLIEKLEGQSATARLDMFRLTFLIKLNLLSALSVPNGDLRGDAHAEAELRRVRRITALLSFLKVLFVPTCSCGRSVPAARPVIDLFPVVWPLGRLVAQAATADPACPQHRLFALAVDTATALLTCPIRGADDHLVEWVQRLSADHAGGAAEVDRKVARYYALWMELLVMACVRRLGRTEAKLHALFNPLQCAFEEAHGALSSSGLIDRQVAGEWGQVDFLPLKCDMADGGKVVEVAEQDKEACRRLQAALSTSATERLAEALQFLST